ncbi:MAG: tetratricopeptide repeat protein, partial [Marinovum algicola]
QHLFANDHPDIVTSLNNLAYLYQSQGRLAKAESFYQQALAMNQRLFVGNHPYMARSLNNLAHLYELQ